MSFQDTIWMQDVPLDTLAICRMGAKKNELGDEAYDVEAKIDIN